MLREQNTAGNKVLLEVVYMRGTARFINECFKLDTSSS
jgi:hypothetical protein